MPSVIPILSCKSTTQLAELVAHIVPKIWIGNPFVTIDRHTAFKFFCQKLLKATKISTTCVLLALFYIYRLRVAYPSIRGSMGSEVRLFTTALVLANKFLEDNTFTNKTWSDVSNISIKELNIMELEFLSALNYQIYIDHTHFFQWAIQCQHWSSQLFYTPIFNSTRPFKMPTATVMPITAKPSRTSMKRTSGSVSPEAVSYSMNNQHNYCNNGSLNNKRIRLLTAAQEQIRWEPILSWSSSNTQTSGSVATIAAATTTFIPTVRCLEIE